MPSSPAIFLPFPRRKRKNIRLLAAKKKGDEKRGRKTIVSLSILDKRGEEEEWDPYRTYSFSPPPPRLSIVEVTTCSLIRLNRFVCETHRHAVYEMHHVHLSGSSRFKMRIYPHVVIFASQKRVIVICLSMHSACILHICLPRLLNSPSRLLCSLLASVTFSFIGCFSRFSFSFLAAAAEEEEGRKEGGGISNCLCYPI